MFYIESLRKYPPLLFLSRVCNANYVLPPPSKLDKGNPVEIKKGTPVIIPVLGIHKDEALYPDPETYNPDRFSERKDGSVAKYFLAFGAGPRTCLGK